MLRVRLNWLPRSLGATREVAAAVEREGLDGIGICDSPSGVDVYVAIAAALGATDRIAAGSNVTNPVTRTAAVHARRLAASPNSARDGCSPGSAPATRRYALRSGDRRRCAISNRRSQSSGQPHQPVSP